MQSPGFNGVALLIALPADWKLMLAMGGAAIAAIAMIVYAFLRPEGDPEAEERKRRLHLNQIGRIAEGPIVDLVENPPEPRKPLKRLFGCGAPPLAELRPRRLVSHSDAFS